MVTMSCLSRDFQWAINHIHSFRYSYYNKDKIYTSKQYINKLRHK